MKKIILPFIVCFLVANSWVHATLVLTSTGANICEGGTASLSVSGATFYNWLPGSLTGSNVIVSPTITTTYTITGNNSSASGITFVTVTVNSLPTIIIGGIPSACVNNPVSSLTATISGSTGALWKGSGIPSSFGNGTYNPGNTSPNLMDIGSGLLQTSLTYTALNTETTSPGIKFINISTTGNGVCAPVTAQSAINYQPAQIVSILGSGSVSICKNNASYSFGTKIINFKSGVTIGQWSTNGSGSFLPGVVLTTSSATVTYLPSTTDLSIGNVQLIIAVSSNDGKGYNCKIAYDTLNITYTNSPTIYITTPYPTVCANNALINLNATITGALSGTWTGGNNTLSSSQVGNNLTATYNPDSSEINRGNVKLYLTANGSLNNCLPVIDSIQISISKASTISTNGNIIVCYTTTGTVSGTGGTTNINTSINSAELEIYPNPSHGEYIIKTSQPMEIEIFNSIGMTVSRSFIKETSGFFLSQKGVYLVRSFVNNKFIIKKIVIE